MSPLKIGIIIIVVLIFAVVAFILLLSQSQQYTAPTQLTPAPTQPVPTQPVPTQPVPTQPVPTQPVPTQPIPTQPIPIPVNTPKIDCKVSEWNIPLDLTCQYNQETGNWQKTKTRTILEQPQNGGNICPQLSENIICNPINCQVGIWNNSQVCDSDGNRTRTRTVITQPKFGGTVCPALSEKFKDNKCYTDEICGTVVENMSLTDNATLQSKIYNSESNKIFWQGYNCSLTNKKSSGISTNNLCNFINSVGMNSSNYNLKEASPRAKFLLKCPGSLIDVTNFIGAGNTTDKYFTITVKSVDSGQGGVNSSSRKIYTSFLNELIKKQFPQSIIDEVKNGNILMMGKNIGKQIRIWYNDDGAPTGWALNNDWVYPLAFQGLTVSDFGIFEIESSALEIYDKPVGTGIRNKVLLWLGTNFNNPLDAIKSIVTNKPTELDFKFGADKDTFLGTKDFTGYLTYGDEPIPYYLINQIPSQQIRYNNLYKIMTSKLNLQP